MSSDCRWRSASWWRMGIARGSRRFLNALQEGLRPLIPIIILLFYTLLGAVLFMYIEGPNEQYTLREMEKEQAELIQGTAFRLNNVRGMKPIQAYNHTMSTLEYFRKKLGVSPVNASDAKWTFWGSVFYSLTVYTTIGYGNIFPVTVGGRVLTILYAFIGIPLALITLIALGGLFAKICKFVWTLIVRSVAKSTSVVSKDLEKQVYRFSIQPDKALLEDDESGNSANSNEDLLNFPVSFLIVITILWVFFSAWVFLFFEQSWSYGVSLYFTLISFTTIGFGDVLPSQPDYMIVIGICVLIGLSLVSTVLTIIQQQIEALANGMDADIDKEYRKTLESAYENDDFSDSAVVDGKAAQPLIQKGPADGAAQDSSGAVSSDGKASNRNRMDDMVSRMPWKSRLLYSAMSTNNRKKIAARAESRLNVRVVGTQTDAFLLQALIAEHLRRVGYQPSPFETVANICNAVIQSISENDLRTSSVKKKQGSVDSRAESGETRKVKWPSGNE